MDRTLYCECGKAFIIPHNSTGRRRTKCYDCSPRSSCDNMKKLNARRLERERIAAAKKAKKPKPVVYEEVPGASYKVFVTPWSKLRQPEVFDFVSRNAAEKCKQQYIDFGEYVRLQIISPPVSPPECSS